MNIKQVTCPMCGMKCKIGGDDKEGTHYYIPLTDEGLQKENEIQARLLAKGAEREDHLIAENYALTKQWKSIIEKVIRYEIAFNAIKKHQESNVTGRLGKGLSSTWQIANRALENEK